MICKHKCYLTLLCLFSGAGHPDRLQYTWDPLAAAAKLAEFARSDMETSKIDELRATWKVQAEAVRGHNERIARLIRRGQLSSMPYLQLVKPLEGAASESEDNGEPRLMHWED